MANDYYRGAVSGSPILGGWAVPVEQALETVPASFGAEGRLPSEQALEAMDKAFLKLNRSGLAMNKLFNFVDRVQKMQDIEARNFDGLPEALAEAGNEIKRLQRAVA
ncbi:MAG: hypothetical protein HC771_21975 [Synechococcales cyanobacterium CRU_2_2]|nr:hypothetical protein [Synechococcales cyanobacterium CRU_2_2]